MNTVLNISTMPERVKAQDLSYFLYLFTSAYNAATSVRDFEPQELLTDDQVFFDVVRAYREQLTSFDSPTQPYLMPLPQPLEIVSLSIESPLKSVIAGSIAAITLAVIVSGGKIEISAMGTEIKAELLSLGHGIERLRRAFTVEIVERPSRETLEVREGQNGAKTIRLTTVDNDD